MRNQGTLPKKPDKTKKLGPTKTLVKWVDLFTCFHCGKEGRSPPLRRCSQCEIAYYCSKTCQKAHWRCNYPGSAEPSFTAHGLIDPTARACATVRLKS